TSSRPILRSRPRGRQQRVAPCASRHGGAGHMVVPLYEDLQRYICHSAVFGIGTMATPMLLMTGDSDGTVYWQHQSVEFYNIARRAKALLSRWVSPCHDLDLKRSLHHEECDEAREARKDRCGQPPGG